MNYGAKDIFLERATTDQTFEEYPLHVQPNSVVVADAYGNLAMVDTSSFLAGTGSITLSISSSVSDSASWAKQAESASYSPYVQFADSASYTVYSDNAGFSANSYASIFSATASVSETASYAATSSYAISASFSSVINVSAVSSASWASQSLSSSYSKVAGQSISSSFSPIPLTYPLTILSSNQVSYSVDFSIGQYFQLNDTGSNIFISSSLNGVAVNNAVVFVPSQSVDRLLTINPNWVVFFPTPVTIPATKTAVLSLTSFGLSESTVVFAYGIQA